MELLGGLHALGDNGHGEGPGKLDDKLQHAGVAALGKGVADKLHVQFQGVDGQGGEHIQGRIARAEVIHLHLKAQHTQGRDGLDDLVGVLGIGRLRDLQQQILRRQPVFPQKLREGFHKAGVEHVHP